MKVDLSAEVIDFAHGIPFTDQKGINLTHRRIVIMALSEAASNKECNLQDLYKRGKLAERLAQEGKNPSDGSSELVPDEITLIKTCIKDRWGSLSTIVLQTNRVVDPEGWDK